MQNKIIIPIIVFIIVCTSVYADSYDKNVINETRWFNVDAVSTEKTRGVYMYFFLALLLFGLIAYAEFIKIPILFILIGILNFFFSIFIYMTVSAIFGMGMTALSIFLFTRGIFLAR